VIFKAVRDGTPYAPHGLTMKEWAEIPPRPVRLDQLITTKRELALDKLLAEDSTFYGDLFPHVVLFNGAMYLEDGLHRALRAALQQRTSIHARVLLWPRPPARATASASVAVPMERPAPVSGSAPVPSAADPTTADVPEKA
jgi:Arc/MetJ family transcription regulator